MIVLIPTRDPNIALINLVTGLREHGLRDLVVVDDGSGPDAAPVLAAIAGQATVLTHAAAAGKGRALKTASRTVLPRTPARVSSSSIPTDGTRPRTCWRWPRRSRANPAAWW